MDIRSFFRVGMVFVLMFSSAYASGRISAILVGSASVRLTVETTSGASYTVQCSTNLQQGAWMDLEEFTAVSNQTVKVYDEHALSCCFRVIRQQDNRSSSEPPPPDEPPPPPPPF